MPQNIGYSISPMHDSIFDSGILGSSTPRHKFGIRDRPALPSPASSPLMLPISAGATASTASIPRLTLGPPAVPVGDMDQSVFMADEAESDILPFALDTGDLTGSGYEASRGAVMAAPTGAAVPVATGDEAVGAFVRLMAGAPPLRRHSPSAGGPPAAISRRLGLCCLALLPRDERCCWP
eukprot:jgi/Botrbrau1/19359/Bobra.0628s0004.1